jgi:hypothetical protein
VVIDKQPHGLKKYAQFWTGKRNFGDRLFCYDNVHHTGRGTIMGFCCEAVTSYGLKSLTTCWTSNLPQERFRIADIIQRYYWFKLDRSIKHYHFKNMELQFVTVLNIIARKQTLGSRSEICMSTTWKPLRSELHNSIKQREWEISGRKKSQPTASLYQGSRRAGQWKHTPALSQYFRCPGWNPNTTVENMCRTEGKGSTFLRNVRKFLLDYKALNPRRW